MMAHQSTNVFVSYSHADAALVAPVVRLLRVNKSLVFQDVDDIQPGKKWRSELARGLAEANMVVVFWCDHACRSEEVSKEWKAAIQLDKDLLPLLLDATPLPPELSEYQWIDFRGTVGPNHVAIKAPPQPSATRGAPAMRKRRLSIGGVAAGLSALLVASLLTLTSKQHSDTSDIPGAAPPLPPRSIFERFFGDGAMLLWLTVLLGLAVFLLVWRMRRRSRRKSSVSQLGAVEHRLASAIESEILRRTGSKK